MRLLGIERPGSADVMTLCNASCGASAILVVISFATRSDADLVHAGVRLVALLMIAGTMFDSLDGIFARRRGGGTSMGGMLDSLADAVTFGLAPAVLLIQIGLRGAGSVDRVLLLLGFLVYVAGALLRLADFSSARHADSEFTGLPSPLAAVLLLSVAFLTSSPALVAIALAGAGLMMVSRISYPLQRGPVLAAAGLAWVFGLAGTLGLYDVKIPATVALLVIVVVMPLVSRLHPHERAARSASF